MAKIYALYEGQLQWVESSLLTVENVLSTTRGQVSLVPFDEVGEGKVWGYGGSFVLPDEDIPEDPEEDGFRTVSVNDSISYVEGDPLMSVDGEGTYRLDSEGLLTFVLVEDIDPTLKYLALADTDSRFGHLLHVIGGETLPLDTYHHLSAHIQSGLTQGQTVAYWDTLDTSTSPQDFVDYFATVGAEMEYIGIGLIFSIEVTTEFTSGPSDL